MPLCVTTATFDSGINHMHVCRTIYEVHDEFIERTMSHLCIGRLLRSWYLAFSTSEGPWISTCIQFFQLLFLRAPCAEPLYPLENHIAGRYPVPILLC